MVVCMYLSKIKIWNFRKFGSYQKDGTTLPGLSLKLSRGLNLLVGENDSGKTSIIDSIKFVLGTQSNDWIKLDEDDFHCDSKGIKSDWLKIECIFKGFTENEAASFHEWLNFDKNKNHILRLTLNGKRKSGSTLKTGIYYDIKAGFDDDGTVMNAEAKEKLKVTYLRPLRDAVSELAPKRGSRLSQILSAYEIFKVDTKHPLETIMDDANKDISKYFKDGEGKVVLETINQKYLEKFSLSHNKLSSKFEISENELRKILEKLELRVFRNEERENNTYLGLGSNNLLFIAAELLLLKKENYHGLKLALIEEIEAHLHPQSQLNLINFLESNSEDLGFQTIITTHSPTLASKISLKKLILCKNDKAFRMGPKYTNLSEGDYKYLRRFLDDTKSNLFFANGVIIVEGPSENLLLPALAEFIDLPLYKYGISIVNVNSTALLRYSRIFQRQDETSMDICVACITDRDVPPKIAKDKGLIKETRKTEMDYSKEELKQFVKDKELKYEGGDVKTFVSKRWTLEFDIAMSSLRNILFEAVKISMFTDNLEKEVIEEKIVEIKNNCDIQIKEWITIGKTNEEIAIEIFTPIANNNVSKPVVAQVFSILLMKSNNDPELKKKVVIDEYLKYLINAIKYVTRAS